MNRKALIKTLFPKIDLVDIWIAIKWIAAVILGACVLFGIAFAITTGFMLIYTGLVYLFGDPTATLIILSPLPIITVYILIVDPLISRYKRIKMIVELEDEVSI